MTPDPDHDPDRLARALAAIDAANADDPNRLDVRGSSRPKELAHAELVSEWVSRLRPDASEALLLAARAHHLRRWAIPRSDHPEGRTGYLRWRSELQELHAREAAVILEREGYGEELVTRVQDLVRKKNLARDPEVQALEDALCLVFLETQLHALAEQLEPEKLLDVMRKTLRKMSEAGRQLALEQDLEPEDRALLERALAGRRSPLAG
jgi:hypothetical protein